MLLFTGTRETNTLGATVCATSGGLIDRVSLETPYVMIEDPPVTRTDQAFLPPPPTDFMSSAVLQNPTLLERLPYFTDCTIISGTGQPTVHIPVTALTSHSSTTIRRSGDASVSTTTSGKAPTPTLTSQDVPTSTTTGNNVPAPTDTSSSAIAPTTTSSSAPVPTSTDEDVPAPTTTTKAASPPLGTEPAQPGTNTPGDGLTTAPNRPTVPAIPQVPEQPNPTNVGTNPPNGPISPTLPSQPEQPPVSNPPVPSRTNNALPPTIPSKEADLPFPIIPVPVPTATSAGSSPSTTANPGAVILPGDQTLNPGQETTVSGVVISVPSNQPVDANASPSVIIADGRTSTVLAATPVVVIDGTTHTVPIPAPAPTQAVVVPITLGSQVVTIQVPTASGEGVVLPNSETLAIGATTTFKDQTFIASIVTSGTTVATVIEVVDENTTQRVTLPSASVTTGSKTSSKASNASRTTSGSLTEYTGGVEPLSHRAKAWGMINAVGAVMIAVALEDNWRM